eukprot:1188071-Prorocentrum_minimum.AAC.3
MAGLVGRVKKLIPPKLVKQLEKMCGPLAKLRKLQKKVAPAREMLEDKCAGAMKGLGAGASSSTNSLKNASAKSLQGKCAGTMKDLEAGAHLSAKGSVSSSSPGSESGGGFV